MACKRRERAGAARSKHVHARERRSEPDRSLKLTDPASGRGGVKQPDSESDPPARGKTRGRHVSAARRPDPKYIAKYIPQNHEHATNVLACITYLSVLAMYCNGVEHA